MINHRVHILLGMMLILYCQLATASFNKRLWTEWQATNPISQKIISHHQFQVVLDDIIMTDPEGINLIDYSKMTTEHKKNLRQYILNLTTLPIGSYNRCEQLAYWINLYNALTIDVVSKYYPVESIQEINISPGLFNIGPWGANIIRVNGVDLSLEDIHNRIIRPIWNDPRTHYAVHNATIGGANISKKAFKGETLSKQLNQAASDYINSLRAVQIINNELVISKVFDWFKDDFGGSDEHIIQHIRDYAKPPLKKKMTNISKISTYHYNWHLNAAPSTNSHL